MRHLEWVAWRILDVVIPEPERDQAFADELVEQGWELRARDRPGRAAWLGPIAAALGLLCWLTPIGGEIVALVAIGCGTISIVTRRPYRIDWTAVVGICLGMGQLFLALILFVNGVSGP